MKLLLASDLHYTPDLAREIATNSARLPANTYNHRVDGKLYWHNRMMVEAGEQLLDGLEEIVRQEQPDLLIFLGDMVNINWGESVAAVAARFGRFPLPLRVVTGNHDIYLEGAAERVQEAVTPGVYETGLRHETVDGLGLIYLDLFARSAQGSTQGSTQGSAQGEYRKWGDPHAAEQVGYRPEDIAGALALMAAEPQKPWLIFGHFPFVSPDARIDLAGRKVGRYGPGTEPLATHLEQPNNLLGILCGHQHFNHLQRFDQGFHWTLPSLVEYPCAATILEWDGAALQGRIVPVDRELAATSLAARQESWTAGEAQDQALLWRTK
jgi:hypothetical protein